MGTNEPPSTAPREERTTAWWSRCFPPAQWLSTYSPSWLGHDLVAGVTLAAYAIPVSLAYATLAGMPPVTGVYCYLLGGLGYALFGTSRQLAIGPTSAISLLVGVTVAGMANGDPARWAGIAELTALVVACMCVLAWLLRLSTLISFISETILLGFKAGAALSIAMTQLPKLFGVKGGGEHFFERVWILGGELGDTNATVLCFGLAAIALLLLGEKFLPGRPVALFVVVLSIVVMSFCALSESGITIVGALPQGLPELSRPSLRLRDVDGVIALAFACFLLSYIESVSAARTLADKNDYKVDVRQELLGLGAANLATAFGQGYPVAGGLSQSAVNDKAGAKSPLALVFTTATLALCLLYLSGLLSNLPSVVLASVVLVAIKGLIDVRGMRHLFRVSRFEFSISMVALVSVLLLGILKGVLVAALVSILMLLARVARPHVAILGRIPGSRGLSDRDRHPENELLPGVVAFRVESSLLYFNTDHVHEEVLRKILAETPAPRFAVCDLSASPYVDVSGARMLHQLHGELTERGIELRLAGAHAGVRDILRAEGLAEFAGRVHHGMAIEDALDSLGPAARC